MTDIAKVKQQLEEQLKVLESRAQEIDEDLNREGDHDWEEHAIELADDEVQEKMGNVTMDEIQEIKLALSRIEKGSYGICVRCGATIPSARLEILPYSTKCMNCA
jgi:DnaK suppressor protein